MAYCLGSLVQILEQILYPDQHHQNWVLDLDKVPQIQSLLKTACFLRDFLANSTPTNHVGTESLEDRIRDVAEKAEDVLETHIAGQILSTRWNQSFIISPPDLSEVIEEFVTAKEEIMKIMEAKPDMPNPQNTMTRPKEDPVRMTDQLTSLENIPDVRKRSDKIVSSGRASNPKEILVGLSRDFMQLKKRLIERSSTFIIPIVGMGGIGKTTLARSIYDEFIFDKSHFDTCAWATISQDYNLRNILLDLLGCVTGKLTDEMLHMKDSILGVTLYKNLIGRRYLVILDDTWSHNAWDEMRNFIPNENNQSRIILTTRETHVAKYVDSDSSFHQMRLLSPDDGWEILREKIYGKEPCSSEMELVGKRIANNCGGLPLAVQVIGGFLSQAEKRKDLWEQIADNVSLFMENKDERFSGIFSWSYDHLPHYLKPCFLYVGAFPEDYAIRASKLIRLWIAEGFLKSIEDKSLEEAGEVYLKALVDRNLIFVRERKNTGEVKSYGIHDLLRDLCLVKARHRKFLYVKNRHVYSLPDKTICLRRVSVHSSYRIRDVYASQELMSLSRSFLYTGDASNAILSPVFFMSRLLRVLDVLGLKFERFPEELLQLVNLRYLAFAIVSWVPDMSKLRNLQILIVRFNVHNCAIASELFDIPQLRHIKFLGKVPYIRYLSKRNFILEKLQCMSAIYLNQIIKLGLENIPNLKKLGVHCYSIFSEKIDLKTTLCHLETLKCSSSYDDSSQPQPFFNHTLPHSLRKLTLQHFTVPEACLKEIGMLPDLEILNILNCTFEDSTWEPSEGEFCRLQFLFLAHLNLVHWLADQTSFPMLQKLVIQVCTELNIPSDIGEIPTLEIIQVDQCGSSVIESARKIQKEQFDYGNPLQVRISGMYRELINYVDQLLESL